MEKHLVPTLWAILITLLVIMVLLFAFGTEHRVERPDPYERAAQLLGH